VFLTDSGLYLAGGWLAEELAMRGVLAFGILIAGLIGFAAAGEMKSPRVSPVSVDWDSARSELAKITAAPETQATHESGVGDAALARLNAAADNQFTGIGQSSVPVLLPFGVGAP
jgi:hypothetical protein